MRKWSFLAILPLLLQIAVFTAHVHSGEPTDHASFEAPCDLCSHALQGELAGSTSDLSQGAAAPCPVDLVAIASEPLACRDAENCAAPRAPPELV